MMQEAKQAPQPPQTEPAGPEGRKNSRSPRGQDAAAPQVDHPIVSSDNQLPHLDPEVPAHRDPRAGPTSRHAPHTGGFDIEAWQAEAEKHILAQMTTEMTKMLPGMVKNTMVGIATVLKEDIAALTSGQKAMEDEVYNLRREVKATRRALETSNQKVASMEDSIKGLTKAFEDFAVRQPEPRPNAGPASSSSASDPRTSRAPQHVHIGTPRGQSPAQAEQPEAVRTKLVKFPYPVSGDHMKLTHQQMTAYYDAPGLWTNVMPNFPPGGTQFGVIFPDRAAATMFVDTFRADPFRYTPTGEAQVILRPRTETEKQKGRIATHL